LVLRMRFADVFATTQEDTRKVKTQTTRERRSAHDPGVVLRNLAVVIADGGDHVSDLGVLRGQQALFGAVASETTAHRVPKSVDSGLLEALRAARAKALAKAWDAGARPEELILDIDASLLIAHSEKEGAAGNYKGLRHEVARRRENRRLEVD